MVSYLIAKELELSDLTLGDYVLDEIVEPTIADLVVNLDYQESDYVAFNPETYVPVTWTEFETPEWYGTAFGDCGGTPTSSSNGFVAIDREFMYVGIYVTRGTVARFSNVNFEITGNAIEA